MQNEREVPPIGAGYAHTRSVQEQEEERGMPIIVAKDDKTKVIAARVAPSKGVESFAVETARDGGEVGPVGDHQATGSGSVENAIKTAKGQLDVIMVAL